MTVESCMVRKKSIPKVIETTVKCCDCKTPIEVRAWETEDLTDIPCERCWVERLFYYKHKEKKG